MIARGSRSQPLRLGFLLSGSGRSLDNLSRYLADHPGLAEIVLVVSDREDAYGLQRASRLGLATRVLPCRRNPEDSETIFLELESMGAEFVLLAGFLRLLHIPPRWNRRVLNIHPSLIPKFCGKGFYGERVHRAVLEAGEPESGCTVHFVDNIYDHGPILLQKKVPVDAEDTVDTLADRVFEAECKAYPEAVSLLASGQLRWEDDRPVIEEPS